MTTKIEWADESWNPIRARNFETGRIGWHCEKVSPGCANCYAESMNRRLGTKRGYTRGDRVVKNGVGAKLFLDEKALIAPLRWRKPRRVFVCSMTDLFGEWVPDEWIDRIFAVMALTPQHKFQVLTKRAGRMREWFERTKSGAQREFLVEQDRLRVFVKTMVPGGADIRIDPWPGWPLPHVQLGVSAEDQPRLDERVPELLATPAAVRFVSGEPLLGPLVFRQSWRDYLEGWDTEPEHGRHHPETGECLDCPQPVQVQTEKIDWVIVGGESGPRARPMDVAWARSIVKQCREAGIACFLKQLGAMPFMSPPVTWDGEYLIDHDGRAWPALRDSKGGDPEEWAEDLRVREYP